jgi:hypothetical protein
MLTLLIDILSYNPGNRNDVSTLLNKHLKTPFNLRNSFSNIRNKKYQRGPKMHRDTTLVIRNILLEGVETLRSTVETHVNDFKIALDLFEEEISGLTNDSYDLQPENYGDEKQEKYPHSKVMVSELLADSDGLIALLGFDCVS